MPSIENSDCSIRHDFVCACIHSLGGKYVLSKRVLQTFVEFLTTHAQMINIHQSPGPANGKEPYRSSGPWASSFRRGSQGLWRGSNSQILTASRRLNGNRRTLSQFLVSCSFHSTPLSPELESHQLCRTRCLCTKEPNVRKVYTVTLRQTSLSHQFGQSEVQ